MRKLSLTETTTRLVRVITRLNLGGPARQALMLTARLRPRYATTLIAGAVSEHEVELTDPDVPVTRVPLGRAIRPFRDVRAYLNVRRSLVENEARIVHSHMAKAGTIARMAGSSINPRPVLVHTFHGHVLSGYFNRIAEESFIRTERRLAKMTDALVAVSPEIRDELLDLGIGSADKFHVIPLGFDLDEFLTITKPEGVLRRRLGLGDDLALIGTVGRLVPIKDQLTLIRAMEEIPHAHLAILGDGELRGDLEMEVRSRGLTERVHFVGWWREMSVAMADFDVVALTSLNEGTPVVLIEALASGCPVVSTDVGGVRSVVKNGETGLLAPARDESAIASAITRLLNDEQLRRRMGELGREEMRVRFGSERLVGEIESLYRDLVQRHPWNRQK